jgi:hypothetical protein
MRLKYFISMYENIIITPVKICLKGGEGNKHSNSGSESNQSALYACVEISH